MAYIAFPANKPQNAYICTRNKKQYIMAFIKSIRGFTPSFGKNCYIADNASVIGNVTVGDNCSIWFNATVRGDVNSIRIGSNVNIQDGVVIHGTYQKASVTIGDNVSIAHNAVVHGCAIEQNVLIGMGAIIMDNAIIKSNSIIAAGSVIPQNFIVESGSVYGGIPARKIKEIDKDLIEGEIIRISKGYLMYAEWFK